MSEYDHVQSGVGNASATTNEIKPSIADSPVRRDLLEHCYNSVTTLREHVLAKLPSSSRLRRKKIARIGLKPSEPEINKLLVHLLDTALICSSRSGVKADATRWEQWLSFSQKGDESYISLAGGLTTASVFSQSEIIDFVIWLLFSKDGRSKHLLCNGYQKRLGMAVEGQYNTSIPDVISYNPNSHASLLRETPWPQLLALLGRSGEKMMIDLLLDHAIYTPVEAGFQNYHQLSGIPLSEHDLSTGANSVAREQSGPRKPGDIMIMRSKVFYAKPSLTAKRLVLTGFKHIHVLNRCPYTEINHGTRGNSEALLKAESQNNIHTLKVMMYIFPRQFGLHNVFTSKVDNTKTTLRFQDYTLREDEIAPLFRAAESNASSSKLPKVPKRLRGQAEELTRSLQIRHKRCSYYELLRHHCPCVFDKPDYQQKVKCKKPFRSKQKTTDSQSLATSAAKSQRMATYGPRQNSDPKPQYKSVVDLATPYSKVSAFCRAALSKVIPNRFWGEGETHTYNQACFLRKVNHFVTLRQFEMMSLHEIAQGFKITSIDWLQPPRRENAKLSRSDIEKRREIFYEFLYYIFDSLLIPLLRSNFYVTESNTHKYQIFYFRHEVWRYVAEPSMAALKGSMFEEVKLEDALQILESRRLGFGQMRLLPKGQKLRPITNLRRRALTRTRSKSTILGPSINAILRPIYTVIKLEKSLNPSKLGSTLFSVNDIYPRLKKFKQSLGTNHGKLFFAKLDVQAAFDTIPQAAAVKLMASVPSQARYVVTKHAEVKPGERPVTENAVTKSVKRWHDTAMAEGGPLRFPDRLKVDLAAKKKNTVFIDTPVQRVHYTGDLINLLREHVEQNLVKVGKKYYRQKIGIPQGSVVSSFLCNYLYADLEKHHLEFLDSPDSLLLRLTDDFLLITLDEAKGRRFVEIMHRGLPDYGVEVSPIKTLVNFDMSVEGDMLRRVDEGEGFPYCGTRINCQTLDVSKDRQRDQDLATSSSLTVDFGRTPGQNFQRKVINAFKINSHLMFFDTSHNSASTVLNSLQDAFKETANKMRAYIHCLPKPQQPSSGLIIRTITKLIDVAFVLLTGKSRSIRYPEYQCNIRKTQLSLVACLAFTKVLSRRQTEYHQVIKWLRVETDRLASGKRA